MSRQGRRGRPGPKQEGVNSQHEGAEEGIAVGGFVGLALFRRSISLVLFTCAVIATPRLTQAGTNVWTSHGPEGGHIVALAINPATPSTLYAGTGGGGVFKSTDSGASWLALNDRLSTTYVVTLAIEGSGTSLHAGTYGGGVFDLTLACVVGTGRGASCTESALAGCLPGGGSFDGTTTFNCGLAPKTITLTSTKTISNDTTINGGSMITISGGNSVGVFSVSTGVKFTVQNVTIANGQSGVSGAGIDSIGGTLTVTNSIFCGITDLEHSV